MYCYKYKTMILGLGVSFFAKCSFLRNFALRTKYVVQFRFLSKMRKYAQNLLRVMRNNAEYCAKVVPLHAQMMRKSYTNNFLSEIAHILRTKLPFRDNPNCQ